MATIKFKPHKKVAYDKTPLQLKVSSGVRERVMSIPGWQERVRGFLDEMIDSSQKPTEAKED